MLGLLAIPGCFWLIAWLFRMDLRLRKASTPALWVPALWIAIVGSRPVVYWFTGSAAPLVGADMEGSSINTFTYAALMGAAILVLLQRPVNWGAVIGENKALLLLYLFFAFSSLWSPYTGTSFKRLFKDFGNVLMVLVLLTDATPWETIKLVFTRVSYLLLPLSVILAKYFPHAGRVHSNGGETMFTGVTTHKNTLGLLVMVMGLMLLAEYLELRERAKAGEEGLKLHLRARVIMLAICGYLLYLAHCATANLSVALGLILVWAFGKLPRMRNGRAVLAGAVLVVGLLIGMDKSLGISDAILQALGRNATLTGRTEIWETLLRQGSNSLLGNGFYIFWDTDLASNFHDEVTNSLVTSAHNGYLETYLDGGLIGLILLTVLLLAATAKFVRKLFEGTLMGRMGFIFFILTLIYDCTESQFFRLNPLWFVFLLLVLDYPQAQTVPARTTVFVEEAELEPASPQA